MEQTLLLVDDEENITRSLVRLFRREGYQILTADSGQAGLDVLEKHSVDVIVSDQRMPGMTGVEFLSQVKERWPGTVRIVLSGYTELDSVTDAINRGAVYKFLTKPWEDELLKENVREAFESFALRMENERLTRELLIANQHLEKRVETSYRDVLLSANVLKLSQEILEVLPFGILGISHDGLIVLANRKAHELFCNTDGSLITGIVEDLLPVPVQRFFQETPADGVVLEQAIELENGASVRGLLSNLDGMKNSRGKVGIFIPRA